MASLADVAIGIYAAESVLLRVAKGAADREGDGGFFEGLAAICLAGAVDVARREAREILAALSPADELAGRLARVEAWLPLPAGLIETRGLVARAVLEAGGLPVAT